MKFICIADTHGKHKELLLPPGDVLIHAGDVSMKGTETQINDFLNWFSQQDFTNKIMIAGNHDFYFERETKEKIEALLPGNIIYLNDSQVIVNGIRIWGSPITPWFYNWAFNRHRGEAIKKHWDHIPPQTDILVTHGPVFNILDKTTRGEHTGCKDLLQKTQEIMPAFHICGHIHEAYGTAKNDSTQFINASVSNERDELENEPIAFDI